MALLSPSTFLASTFWSFFSDPTNMRRKCISRIYQRMYKPEGILIHMAVKNGYKKEIPVIINQSILKDKICHLLKARENAYRW